MKRILKSLAIAALSVWALVVTIPVAAQVYTSYAALDGSQSAPSYSFNGATNSGMYRDGNANQVMLANAGNNVLRLLNGGPMVIGQLRASQSKTPTVNGSNTIVGTDTFSVITAVGSPTSIVVTFAGTWASAPNCFVSDNRAAAQGGLVTATTTAATLAMATTFTGQAANWGTDTIGLLCLGN